MGDLTKIALMIVTVGLIATVVVNGTNSAKVITAASSGFSNSLTSAEKG
jgi:PRD1 phage membrane DNA delivery